MIFFHIDTGLIDVLHLFFQNHTLLVLDAQHKAIMHFYIKYKVRCLGCQINSKSYPLYFYKINKYMFIL